MRRTARGGAFAWAGRVRRASAGVALLLSCALPAAAQDPYQGPNLLLSAPRLQAVRDAIARGVPLFVACRDQVVREADAFLQRPPDPIHGALRVPGYYTSNRPLQQAIARRLRGDAGGAHALALAFALTQDVRYADRARAYLFAWVDHLTHAEDWGGGLLLRLIGEHRGDTPIVLSYSFPAFCYAYDLLRGLGQVSAAEHARFSAWLRTFVAYHRDEVCFANNHLSWQALFLAAAAHVLEDRALMDHAVGLHRRNVDAQVSSRGGLWRELIRGRKGATYTLMALEAMAQLAHVAEAHGLSVRDLGPGGAPHLRAAAVRLRRFVNDPRSWRRYWPLTRTLRPLDGPARPSDWGWLFEVTHAWWGDPADAALLGQAPYGLSPPRAYTLSFATLCFRPIGAPATGVAPAPGVVAPATGVTGALGSP